jgi:hypothetical protein
MAHVMEVSRPDALAEAPRLIPLDPQGRPIPAAVQVAAVTARASTPTVEQPVVAAPAARSEPVPATQTAQAVAAPAQRADGMFTKLLGFTPNLFGSSEAVKATEAMAPVPLPPPRPRALLETKPQASVITAPPMRMAQNLETRRMAGGAQILPLDLARP